MTGEARLTRMHEVAHAAARVLISSFFLARGFGLIIDPTGMGQFLADNNVPDYLTWPNAGFAILASAAILVGFQTRTAAALLALYVFWSSFILNYRPDNPIALGFFWRDLAMIGGLTMLFSYGRGCFALDNLLEKRFRREVPDTDEAEAAPGTESVEPATEAQA
ncbi:MAG: DoxX family protein [Paracoccaceae bacterium]